MTPLYEKCHSLIVEAVPSIIELGFGCEIEVNGMKRIVLEVDESGDILTLASGIAFKVSKKTLGYSKLIEILGRKIGLADVLLAIGDQGLVSMCIHKGGDFGSVSFIWEPIGSMKHMTWNLAADDLRLQSKETLEFIIKLLEK